MEKRLAYFIMQTDPDNGTITPCIAEENVRGYSRVDYSWKCTKAQANELVKEANARMGITEKDALTIVLSSMLTPKRKTK